MRIRAVRAVRRAFFMSGLTVLAACSGGGGGGIASNTPPPAVPNTPPPAPSPPPVSGPPPPIGVNIAAPAPATLGGNTHIQATAAAPNFSAATPPTPGTVFALNHTAMDISSTAAASVAIGPGTLTVNRVLAGGTADYRLTIPSLSIDVCCMSRSSGAMFGPQGQEIGLVWTLRDSALGRSAIGVFGAAKQ
jgi:hypothetical protein